MTTDMENELRDLFREKAGEAPIATPAATQQVLRRGRRHQVGTVLGSAAVALLLIVGSVAGLQRILGDGPDTFETGEYEVFERTATIEAFTLMSPSDWFLVNHWPVSMQTSFAALALCPEETPTTISDCYAPTDPVQLDPALGLPMFQLTNQDVGLRPAACGVALRPEVAVLYIALDYERDIAGVYPPYLSPSRERSIPAEVDGPCGPGRYASFTVAGEPFFAWVGFGDEVTEDDRSSLLATYESLSVDDSWEPVPPHTDTPAYVIEGGVSDSGEDWRLEVRPRDINVHLALVGGDQEPGTGSFTVPSVPVEWTGTDPIFGAITKAATGVEFWPGTENENYDLGGSPVPGTIVPVPATLGSFDFDLFFIDPPVGYGELGGRVIALGLDEDLAEPAVEPRDDVVELSGTFLEHDWKVRFTGAFAQDSACIRVTVEQVREPLCLKRVETSLASTQPSMHVWVTNELALFAGTVPPRVQELRFFDESGREVAIDYECRMGPLGWTDPDRRVCAIALPPEGSGTLRYNDADGVNHFLEGIGWGSAEAEQASPVDPVHGETYWAVYAWLGAAGAREADDVVAQFLDDHGVQASQGDLACDRGAAEALGTNAAWRVAVYFETEEEANTFALQAGLLDHEARVIARVTTLCLD